MDNLIKTIKRLSDDEYNSLLHEISPNRFSKPYVVLEAARSKEITDSQMIELLQVNPSTYYTLKSRLNSKVATILAKKVDNPISVLLDEVSRVPANLYATNKSVSIRALKELEKQLLEYDMSNDLIIVYKTLARLHMYSPEYDYYNKLHNKFVAFSLASSKMENLFYDYIRYAGLYSLTRGTQELESMQTVIREMSNIMELYDSHRLFVMFNIVRIYYLCQTTDSAEALQYKEMEMDSTLQEIRTIFNKYPLDTFYKNLRFLVDSLYFIYYVKVRNIVRARHHYSQINDQIPDLAAQHILSFHIIQFLEGKLGLYLATNDQQVLSDLNERLAESFDIDKDETFHYLAYQRFLAVSRFYEGDYAGAARIVNQLRNAISLKQYWYVEVDAKLFQALQYALMGEEELCLQITNSISRFVREEKEGYRNIKAFIKLLKASMKSADSGRKEKKLQALWDTFRQKNTGSEQVLTYLQLNDRHIARLGADVKR